MLYLANIENMIWNLQHNAYALDILNFLSSPDFLDILNMCKSITVKYR